MPSPDPRLLLAAEAASTLAEARWRAVFDSAVDGIIVMNARGVIEAFNRGAERLFGYSRNELVGQPVDMLVPPRFRAAHAHHRGRYAEDPRTRPMGAGLELLGRRKDGSEFPVEISLSPLETEDGTLAVSAIRDATERKKAEARLAEKLTDEETATVQAALLHSLTQLNVKRRTRR